MKEESNASLEHGSKLGKRINTNQNDGISIIDPSIHSKNGYAL